MPQLIYSYTAEDVVEANTMVAQPLPSGLATIPESPVKEAPPSASSRLGPHNIHVVLIVAEHVYCDIHQG